MRFDDQRDLLIQELRASGISDESVLKAFQSVPRELYVPRQYQEYAYRNQPLPIDAGQTISQPLMIAIMLQYMQIRSEHKVLEIGTGSGYQTALLAQLAEAVCSVERIEQLSLKAQQILKTQGVKNAYFRIGDGSQGWLKSYPPYKSFDRIIVSAGAKNIPSGLTDQLADGGVMVIPVGKDGTQILTRVIRDKDQLIVTKHGACAFVPLISERD